jgi:hypothetical protein
LLHECKLNGVHLPLLKGTLDRLVVVDESLGEFFVLILKGFGEGNFKRGVFKVTFLGIEKAKIS